MHVRLSFLGLVLAVATLLPAVPSRAADDPKPKDVAAAVTRGADWLKKQFPRGFRTKSWHDPVELVVLTLAHAGVPHSDPVMKAGVETIETCELTFTYRVSTLAMALEHINPRKYKPRLVRCAQWLVDTQLADGSWGYPGSVQGRRGGPKPYRSPPPGTEPGGEPGVNDREGEEPAPFDPDAPVVIERRTDPAEAFPGQKGDFSNTQFALLGLRACRDANIGIPPATWEAALGYLKRYQHQDGGWGYVYAGQQDEGAYASLTAAGVVGAAIAAHGLGKSPKGHAIVKKGLRWLDKRWEAGRNAGIDSSSMLGPSSWQYYHLYAIERVGSVLGVKKLRGEPWFPPGAAWLLETQRPDGSWADPYLADAGPRRDYLRVADTCFAILFLVRATPPLTR